MQVLLPHGGRVKIIVESTRVDVFVYPSPLDWQNSEGTCIRTKFIFKEVGHTFKNI